MYIKSIEIEELKFTIEGKKYDLDRYNIEGKTPLSTQEYTLNVEHERKEISGDCIRYGEWGDLDEEEVRQWLKTIEEAGKLLRPYEGYTYK